MAEEATVKLEKRKVTLFTGQMADLPLLEFLKMIEGFGFDGIEPCCWGDHFDAEKAADITLEAFEAEAEGDPANFTKVAGIFAARDSKSADEYCNDLWTLLAKHSLTAHSISSHLVGQCVCDKPDLRHQAILPPNVWGKGIGADIGEVGYDPVEAEKIRQRAAMMMVITAIAARRFMDCNPNENQWGVKTAVVNGFTGSKIWHLLYPFPPIPKPKDGEPDMIEAGYIDFAARWIPILNAFRAIKVRFALEAHPTEIGFDIVTAQRGLEAIDNHEAFGFNFDPSHLGYQGVDYVKFIRTFSDRIFHVHMKDAWWGHGDGTVGVFGGHTDFGDPRRFWDFRSLGHGDIRFEDIIVALNDIGYRGPLSVEWEDSRMDREHGAAEACKFVKKVDFPPSAVAFDAAFDK